MVSIEKFNNKFQKYNMNNITIMKIQSLTSVKY